MCVPWGFKSLLATFEALKLKQGKLNPLFSEPAVPLVRVYLQSDDVINSLCVILGLISRTRHARASLGLFSHSILKDTELSSITGLHLSAKTPVYHSIIPPVEYLTLPSHYPCCHDLDKVTFRLLIYMF